MVSSPRNEKRGLGSFCCRSRRQPYDLSTARSRAGCPSLYRAIVETACPNDTRNRIGSLILRCRGRVSHRSSTRDLRSDFGVFAPFSERDSSFRRWVAGPIRGNDAQRCQHLRGGGAQRGPPGPRTFGDDAAKKPRERLRRALLCDYPDSHGAKLGIQLAAIDTLLDQVDSGGGAFLLRNCQTGENDSVMCINERSHDGFLSLRRVSKQETHRLTTNERLVAGQVINRGKAGWQRA